MKTYALKVVVEPDEDRWHAYCPALHEQGAATWGYTREEALKSIEEVVHLVTESMVEHNEPLPPMDVQVLTDIPHGVECEPDRVLSS